MIKHTTSASKFATERFAGNDAPRRGLVVFLDVDNTLFDNDSFEADLGARIAAVFGSAVRDRYWDYYEALRKELDYADFIGALERLRRDVDDDPRLLQLSAYLLDYPFPDRVYDGALEAIASLRRFGLPVLLSDGDVVFQPHKMRRAGLWDAVAGHVLIYRHKDRMLEAVEHHYPARHYVMVDDKPRVLAAMKRSMGGRLTTVFVRQGHYANAPADPGVDTPADLTLDGIADLVHYDAHALHVQQEES